MSFHAIAEDSRQTKQNIRKTLDVQDFASQDLRLNELFKMTHVKCVVGFTFNWKKLDF